MAHDPTESGTAQEHTSGTTEARKKKEFFLPILKGLANTIAHIFRREPNTIFYPEERRAPYPGYRGEHRLKRDSLGREKCVACFLCSTACPSHCIEIVAEEAPWDDREKRPRIFNIDMLRCIYCGMCEEACPCDAIELTPIYNIPVLSREDAIYTKEKLLSL
ncbi:MAG TPA: NADH-quinone oxidoreductase subunit I [Planctomycetes bacterium]|nr:NADH-quinone oxidoreductase subunit I [Planctomycetota bacterium]HIN80850.1 NADH-quinone oxidoreductase subunit I [Planctomycetota bacterium]